MTRLILFFTRKSHLSFFLDRAAASFTAGGDIGGDGGGGGGAQGEGGALPRHREGLRPRRL